jgi:predicted transposase/invertase (TIGR01784 family)
MTNAELWAVFFQYLTDKGKRGKIIEIVNHEEGIAMAVETLGTFTQSELEYIRQTTLLKGELDWQSGMANARDEGLEEGRNEASLDIAQKMKTMGFLVEQIQAVTGLSAETIAQL